MTDIGGQFVLGGERIGRSHKQVQRRHTLRENADRRLDDSRDSAGAEIKFGVERCWAGGCLRSVG